MSTLKVDAIKNTSDETRFHPTLGSTQATTSGSQFDFTGIPSWVKRVTVLFDAVSTDGTGNYSVQLGTAGGIVTTGYVSTLGTLTNATSPEITNTTTAFGIRVSSAAALVSGNMVIENIDGNTWVANHNLKRSTVSICVGNGDITLAGALTQLRVSSGDTFDGGQLNLLYE